MLYTLAKPLIFKIDPEKAHGMMISAMKMGMVKSCSTVSSPKLEQNLFGLDFKNPVGMSAGFDKNAEIISSTLTLGFGFAEVGTVTPKPQEGNPKPRVFRDPKNNAVINRMGFPNKGLAVFKKNIEAYAKNQTKGIVGINIGMNKDQTDPAADYCLLIRELAPLADYLTVNISSPNTPGLRDLQKRDVLTELLSKLMAARAETCQQNPPALLVKLAPDLNEAQQEELAQTLLDCKVDGVILSNTTLERPEYLSADFRAQKGGLSGMPVRNLSTKIIRNFAKLTNRKLPIIGVGGISNGEHAYEKIRAGASLVQLYTGLIYEGPTIANTINKELLSLLERDGFSTISQAIGADL